ncbi:MAG TPA: hypothetical protein VFG95_00960 [Nitrospiria bacterium]|nr:hypothetical protein [Nitrospiria bacterium]
MPNKDGKRKGYRAVPLYYIENEREIHAYRKILDSLIESQKTFGEHLQNLYYQFTGETIPEIKFFYDPDTLEEHYQIRVSQLQYQTFLEGYWAVERYLPYLEKQVDPTAIAMYREIGEILAEGIFSGTEDEAA